MKKHLSKKLQIKILPALLFCWLAGVAQLFAGNLLLNPGFESDPTGQTTTIPGWNAYGGNAYSETSAVLAHSGTNYFKVYQAFNGQVNYTGVYQDYISGPGATYSANGWACTLASDKLAGQNIAWIEVTFRDANANVLALYRSALITTNSIATGAFPLSTWIDLSVTNQYNPDTFVITNTTTSLLAPGGTYFVRYQIVLQGDTNNSNGSMYFDDLSLAQISNAPYGNMNIVWDDEFNGSSIDTNIWTFDLGNGGSNPGWGNNELEYYTSNTTNAYISNGFLHIVAQAQSTNGFNYTSARMKTQGLFSFTYGRLEWRAQLPVGTGTWPALWALGTNIASISWPGCGEIDVMENNGNNPASVQGSLHSGSDKTAIYHFISPDSVTNFHTYTLDWTSNAILYYVDGHLYETQTSWSSSTGNAYPFPFNQPFFLIMNMAIGGNYVGNPSNNVINSGTVFPSTMLIDYVRIYNVTAPLVIAAKKTGSNIILSWPTNIIAQLQVQTNGISNTNWTSIAATNNQAVVNPNSTQGFYRLISP